MRLTRNLRDTDAIRFASQAVVAALKPQKNYINK